MIRPVTKEDQSLFLSLMGDFYNTEAVQHPVPESYRQATFDEVIKPSPYARAYIIEHEKTPAGYALLALTFSSEAGGMVVWLEELYIDPAFQGHGLGSEFLAFLKQEYAGAKRLRLEVTEHNQGAVRLYEREGFVPLAYKQMVLEMED